MAIPVFPHNDITVQDIKDIENFKTSMAYAMRLPTRYIITKEQFEYFKNGRLKKSCNTLLEKYDDHKDGL